jgi:hypothetical protein
VQGEDVFLLAMLPQCACLREPAWGSHMALCRHVGVHVVVCGRRPGQFKLGLPLDRGTRWP